jgi:hypothetical protein
MINKCLHAETSPNNVYFVATENGHSKRVLVIVAVVEEQKKKKVGLERKRSWKGKNVPFQSTRICADSHNSGKHADIGRW